MDNLTIITDKSNLTTEERLVILENGYKDLSDLCRALGRQNTDLKTKCNSLEIDIAIIKQGGNI